MRKIIPLALLWPILLLSLCSCASGSSGETSFVLEDPRQEEQLQEPAGSVASFDAGDPAGHAAEAASVPDSGQNLPTAVQKDPDIVVHVCGAVISPGVYTLAAGSRICQAVEAAGGFAKEAEACAGLMYRVAYTILHNDADCQDAVQDALLKAWAKRNSLREEQYFRTWITRILINACHDLVRKRSRLVLLDTLSAQAEAFPDPALAMALEKLPEKLRMPLTLFYSENMNYAEIGRALRIPVSTVQSMLRRGKAQLRKELGEGEAVIGTSST